MHFTLVYKVELKCNKSHIEWNEKCNTGYINLICHRKLYTFVGGRWVAFAL